MFLPSHVVIGPDAFDESVASGLREQLEVYHTFAGDVDCVFLANMNFNAIATSAEGRYAIGINVGAAVLIARYAYCLLSDPAMLPSIGDPSRESVDPYVVESLRTPNDGRPTTSYGRYMPRDPARLEAAKQISLAAYLMLFFHELNHIELGHVDFARKRLGAIKYHEITAVPITAEDAAVLRALELEADLAALYRSLRVWRAMHPLFDHQALATLTPEISWFVAVELVFWIIDFVQTETRVGLRATHPTPVARHVNAQETTSVVTWAPAMTDPGDLIGWVMRNQFPSRALTDAQYGNRDRAKQELAEIGSQLVTLLPILEGYRRFADGAGPRAWASG